MVSIVSKSCGSVLAGVDDARFGAMGKHNFKSQRENLEIKLLKAELFKQRLWNMGLAFCLLVAVVSFLLALMGILDRPSEIRVPLVPIPSGG